MAVIFAIGGVIVVGVIAHTDYSDYSDYYSNYSNYSNYSDYSDAAERRRRRIARKQAEVDQALSEMRDSPDGLSRFYNLISCISPEIMRNTPKCAMIMICQIL